MKSEVGNDTVHAIIDKGWCLILEVGEREEINEKTKWLLADSHTILKMGKMIGKTHKRYDSELSD